MKCESFSLDTLFLLSNPIEQVTPKLSGLNNNRFQFLLISSGRCRAHACFLQGQRVGSLGGAGADLPPGGPLSGLASWPWLFLGDPGEAVFRIIMTSSQEVSLCLPYGARLRCVCFLLIYFIGLYFLEQFRARGKIEERVQRFLINSLPPTSPRPLQL